MYHTLPVMTSTTTALCLVCSNLRNCKTQSTQLGVALDICRCLLYRAGHEYIARLLVNNIPTSPLLTSNLDILPPLLHELLPFV